MNQHSSLRTSGSLLERASEMFDFNTFATPALQPIPVVEPAPILDLDPAAHEPGPIDLEAYVAPSQPVRPVDGRRGAIDREALAGRGFIRPDSPVGGLAEEFRIVKRQLLRNRVALAAEKRHSILVCSAQARDGKSFCAINLALSLASEQDVDVLLVDGDFSKPEIVSALGLEDGPGFIDAIADPRADPEGFVIRTDIPGLSVLPAGRRADNVTELLASERTAQILARLGEDRPDRIVLFDSPPALMASPAAVLAGHVGQLLMVVRADTTTEADLREALALLAACPTVSLLLNAAALSFSGQRFGGYYGASA